MKSARLFFTIALLNLIINSSVQSVLIFEDFETGDFFAKGWYGGFPDQCTVNEFKNGSYSYAGNFTKGATKSGSGRHLFNATDKVYISYWVKYSNNWVGSGVGGVGSPVNQTWWIDDLTILDGMPNAGMEGQ